MPFVAPSTGSCGITMKRRAFLKGAGGAAVAVPFLPSLEKPARAQSAAPRRLVIFFTPNGCLTNRWFPSVEHGAIDAGALEGTTLEPLSSWAHKLLFPRGLAMFPRGVINGYFDPEDQGMGTKLTCAPIESSGDHWALGRSLDHVAAELVNPAGEAPLVLSVGRAFLNVKGIVSYSAPLEPYLPETNPATVYSNLTGLLQAGSQMSEADWRVQRGASAIDAVRDELEVLRRYDMSAADQQKLSDWLDLLRDVEGIVVPESCNFESAEALGLTESSIQEVSGDLDTATAHTLGGAAMLKLITLSMMCDQNRSIVMQWPAFVTFNWDGIHHDYDAAGLAHRNGSAAVGGVCIEGVLDMLREIDEWYAGRYAELVSLIDSIPEGDGTLLDNCAVTWIPEFADGLAHNINNLPIVIAGSAGGYLQQGISVNLEGSTLGTGNSEATCVDGGEVELGVTGSSTGQVPLNKLYVTLLNALGATNDDAPITEFGVADSNDIEAGITDPGELDALRA